MPCFSRWALPPNWGGGNVIETCDELRGLLRAAQENFMVCAPPSTETYLHQSAELMFVDWSGFPRKFIKRAYARMEEETYGLVPKYDLILWEDARTREIVVENMYGNEIARLVPEVGFDPLGWAKTSFGIGSATELTDFQRTIHDSAHTALALTLTPVEFATAFAIEPAPAPAMAMTFFPMPPGGTNTTSGGSGGVSNQPVTVAFPLPAGFSGLGELFVREGLESYSQGWAALDAHLTITNDVEFSWTDPASTNRQRRFYILGDMLLDDDGDGYSNLREALTTTNDPGTFDHVDLDGDGLHDWYEFLLFTNLAQNATDDADGDGLANGEEIETTPTNVVFNSNPALADTDGDGTDDGIEVNQGSDPNDASDGGAPPAAPETVALTLDFECEGSPDTRFAVGVSGEDVSLTNFYEGVDGDSTTVNLNKGKSYVITISNVDYDEAGTNGYTAAVTGNGFVLDDSQGNLGEHPDANMQNESVTATIHVPEVLLTLSTNTMTLKHYNQCELNVVTKPDALAFTDHKIKIIPSLSDDPLTYTLASGTNYTWTTKVAGQFEVFAEAWAGGKFYISTNQNAEVQFPSRSQIEADAGVIAEMEALWQQTIAASTPTTIQEFAFIIYYNALTDAYETGDIIEGDECAPGEQAGVGITHGFKFYDDPHYTYAKYSVADFHTHPPYTYGHLPGQKTGPSDEDKKNQKVPGFVYDYDEYKVPGHSETNGAHVWSFGPERREFYR